MGNQIFTIITAISAAIIALISQIMVIRLQRKVKRSEEIEKLRERYSNPLIRASEEIYNKINDVVKNRKFPLSAFKNLSSTLNELKNLSDISSSSYNVYLTRFIYLFAQFFGAVKLIDKELGFLKLASSKETREFHTCLKKTLAVFYSGRLRNSFQIIQHNNMKYHGRIIDGSQVLIGESMLNFNSGSAEIISYTEFCTKLVTNNDFRITISPIIVLLEDLNDIELTNDSIENIDYRWTTLMLFAYFLNRLINKIDTSNVVHFLSETEIYTNSIIKNNIRIIENLKEFDKNYGKPCSYCDNK